MTSDSSAKRPAEGRVQSVERSVEILEALITGPKTVTEVARATGLVGPTALRLLRTLGHHGLVVRDDETGRYMLGPAWLRMLDGASESFGSIGMIAREPLQRLATEANETAVVHARAGRDRICVALAESQSPLRYAIKLGTLAPLHVGSTGKALLAFMEPEAADQLIAVLPLTRVTSETVTRRAELQRQLAEIRAQGWAYSFGERTPGAFGLSVPIRSADGLLLTVSVIGPGDVAAEGRQPQLLALLRTAAAEIERSLDRVVNASW